MGFEEVYLRYAPTLRKIAVRKFRIPIGEAESLVHDVFATYFMHAASVNAVEPYLIGAICNASRYYLRRSDAADALFCSETPCMALPDRPLQEEIDRKLLLARILAGVGRRCRDLLHRYYVNGETTSAIACAIDSTPGTVLVFLHKCRKRALETYRAASGSASGRA
ncbi:MAG TPA: sigma-70 family RNA polymerase sigma factor [Thermoanaerobaculia bacterium]|nr:sigma-70 family RNA polymerase sigma factor [Thermoanaerobaculia bacterium]